MGACIGTRNTAGFRASVNAGVLPPHTHITYEGLFNQTKYNVGPRTQKTLDLHLGYSRFQFLKSQFDPNINDYLALFLKGKADGQEREGDVNMNLVVCLDISGSMGGGLGGLDYNQPHKSRLKLSIEAIKMLISKLKPNDSLGMVVFNGDAQTVFECTQRKNITAQIYEKLDEIYSGGGTTIIRGFEESKRLLDKWKAAHPDPKAENRIVMLTDVCDEGLSQQKDFIEGAAEKDKINTSIIGISTDFQSSVCQLFKDIKGFNYFCAINQDDIKKYVLQTFDFGFFTSANNIEITLDAPGIENIEVFGTPDSEKVAQYRAQATPGSPWTVSKIKSSFPSEIQMVDQTMYTIGGLILVKIKKTEKGANFKGKVHLKYDDPDGKTFEQDYPLNFEFHPEEQFFNGDQLREAIEGFAFTSELKGILKEVPKLSREEVYKKYWDMLTSLEPLCPKSKLKEYQSFKKILKDYKPKQLEKQEEEPKKLEQSITRV